MICTDLRRHIKTKIHKHQVVTNFGDG